MHALGATRTTTGRLGGHARVGLHLAEATLARAAAGAPNEVDRRLHGPVEILSARRARTTS
eukprot:8957574-Lingulodinium_polyedra.AAC.1